MIYHEIEIWTPKFSTREVLIKPYQVKEGPNKVIFTKCSLPDMLIHSTMIRKCPMVPHGKTGAYAVPLKLMSAAKKTDQLQLI